MAYTVRRCGHADHQRKQRQLAFSYTRSQSVMNAGHSGEGHEGEHHHQSSEHQLPAWSHATANMSDDDRADQRARKEPRPHRRIDVAPKHFVLRRVSRAVIELVAQSLQTGDRAVERRQRIHPVHALTVRRRAAKGALQKAIKSS